MENLKLQTFDELLDRDLGVTGTPERDEFDRQVADDIHAYHVGEAIKQARLAKNLTQEELGERIGVQRAQISRLEKGKSLTVANMIRVFNAMGITLVLDMEGVGKVALY
jgi:ribosome-binding protein aMBF1 (putative translation factor)